MLTPSQCRMARAALQIGVRELAQLAGVSAMTVTRFENEHSSGSAETQAAIRTALEAAGVNFIPENGGGPGVRLRERRGGASEDVAE
jgi:transcriptional regulator with XRE-family HTH domain